MKHIGYKGGCAYTIARDAWEGKQDLVCSPAGRIYFEFPAVQTAGIKHDFLSVTDLYAEDWAVYLHSGPNVIKMDESEL
jgi:hypothetical protein